MASMDRQYGFFFFLSFTPFPLLSGCLPFFFFLFIFGFICLFAIQSAIAMKASKK